MNNSAFHPQHLRCVAAEDGDFLLVRQRGGAHDVIDRMLVPWNRRIGADHQLAGADLRDDVAQRFRGEDQRIEIHLVQIQHLYSAKMMDVWMFTNQLHSILIQLYLVH
mgnify:CR=1 FL=1